MKKIVLEDIQHHAAVILLDEKRIAAELYKTLVGEISADKIDTQKQLRELKQTLHNLDMKIEQFYEDKITGVITVETFTKLASKTEVERNEVFDMITLLEKGIKEAKTKMIDIQNWISLIKKNAAVNDVDRTLIDTLIESIEISESNVENGVKVQDVKIIYKFVGLV